MSGINLDIVIHKLVICRSTKPIARKRRRLGEEKRLTANEETEKLLQARFIEKIQNIHG